MKKRIFFVSLFMMIFMMSTTVYAASINKTSAAIYSGKTMTLKLYGTNIKKVSTGNSNIAVINKKGVVTGKNAGTCYVCVRGTNNKLYKCKVKVVPYINRKTATITYNESTVLKLYGTRIKSAYTSNKKVATITSKGVVKGIRKGTCNVYVKGGNGVTYKCTVKVSMPKLNATKLLLDVGESFDVGLQGTLKARKWYTENSKIATIDKNGVVKAKSKGETYIYVTCDGVIYKCKVRVTHPRINITNKSIYVDKTCQLELYDAKLYDTMTSNSEVATVTSSGLVKGVSEGYCNITLIDTELKKYTCKIVVVSKPVTTSLQGKKVSIIGDSISTFKGKIETGYKTYYPKGEVNMNNQTWWRRLALETKMTVMNNCSWSGSKVIGNSSATGSAKTACSTKRIQDLGNNNEDPDIIICYIGINDYLKMTPIGDWLKKKSYVKDSSNINTFTEGYALMLQKLNKMYPNAEIYCCTLLPIAYNTIDITANENGAGINLDVYNTAIRNIVKCFDAKLIDLNKSGYKISSTRLYTIDSLHPNDIGHIYMKNAIKKELL